VLADTPTGVEAQLTDAQASAVAARFEQAVDDELLRRLWAKDDALWAAGDDAPSNRLGWLTIADRSLAELDEVTALAAELRAQGLTDCVLLGMGGSSLAPEVLARTFAPGLGGLALHVLDSTHPETISELAARTPLASSFFLLSSKSGGTLEPRAMHAYFHELVPDGSRWAAITDPGTALEELAREQGFRRIFHGAPDIGGRYSALSAFGVVPAALIGADARSLLGCAQAAALANGPEVALEQAPAAWLGLALGTLALDGRDKLTLVVDRPLEALGLWLEQLIAESSGKDGRGIVPIADEPLGEPDAYGSDRVFVHVRNAHAAQRETEDRLATLAQAGHPVIAIPFSEPADLGAQFFAWELATAVACSVLGVNPFDQPDVQASKDLTNATIDAYARDRRLPPAGAVAADEAAASLAALLDEHAGAGSYVATMAYLPPRVDEALHALRLAIRRRTGAATTVGYGPRFLHSTGQLHKGGPARGVFVQLVDEHRPADDEVPGAGYGFSTLIHAQALGDAQALEQRGLPLLRIRVSGDAASRIRELAAALDEEGR
jgi:glucose-6-phosphate isomerase